jgi:hypothetical protein
VHRAGSDADSSLLAEADLVVDGMLGIGASGALRADAARLAELARDARLVVAADVPSGVDASTGEVAGTAVRADVTVTFGGLKTGLLVTPGATYAGAVDVADIGLSLPDPQIAALDADDVARMIPQPDADTDKYRRGVVGVVAGSDHYTGAAVLCVGGALHAGAGMVRYAGVRAAAEQVRAHWPEALVTADADDVLAVGRVQSWVVGSGLGTSADAATIVSAVLRTDVPVVLDADALAVVAEQPDLVRGRTAPTLLTPHAGEFAARSRRADCGRHRKQRSGLVSPCCSRDRRRSSRTRPVRPGSIRCRRRTSRPPGAATSSPGCAARCSRPG